MIVRLTQTHIPKSLVESAEMLLVHWGCRKLSDGEGFGVLLLTHHPDGKRLENCCLETHEESLGRVTHEIGHEWPDIDGYVLCYDVTADFGDGLERGFWFEAEARSSESRFVLFHAIGQAADGRWSPRGSFGLVEMLPKLIQT